MNHWTNRLIRLDACREAVEWAKNYESLDAAWAACERGDWMLWLAGKSAGEPGSDDRRTLTLAACDCAEPAVELFEATILGDTRPRAALDTARRWARNESGVTLGQVRTAARAAHATDAAIYATYADAAKAAYTTNAAANVAYAAFYTAASTAASAAHVAYAATAAYIARAAAAGAAATAYATTYATYANVDKAVATATLADNTARSESLKLSADRVREHYPQAPKIGGTRPKENADA